MNYFPKYNNFGTMLPIGIKDINMKKSKLFLMLAGLLLAFNIFISIIGFGSDKLMLCLSDLLPVVCAFLACCGLFLAYKQFKEFDFVKKSWLLILIGIVSYFIAETIYFVLEVLLNYDMNKTFPSIADIFWCFGYIPMITGLIMMFVGYYKSGLPMGNMRLYGILSFVILLVAAFVIIYILVPIVKDPESTTLTTVFSLFYPIADVIVVIPVLILMYITSLFGLGAVSKPWRYLAFGFICFTVADLMYSYLVWQDTYEPGGIWDIAWNVGYLLIGLSGVYQYELVESIKEK
jgi:hypothetical protein